MTADASGAVLPNTFDTIDATDRRIINALQRGLPLVPRPYAEAAASLGIAEDELLARLRRLLDRGVLTRFGPLYQIERAGGRFVLCACHAPAQRLDAVAGAINAFPEVAHHYQRAHGPRGRAPGLDDSAERHAMPGLAPGFGAAQHFDVDGVHGA